MNTMNLPGFTADASLYNGKARYIVNYRQEVAGGQPGEPHRAFVIPQRSFGDAPGKQGCIADCIDSGRTLFDCKTNVCRDFGNPECT